MFDAMKISATGLSAETVVVDVVANNLANQDTTTTPTGGPYQSEFAELLSMPQDSQGVGQGVEVGGIYSSATPAVQVYDPTDPAANASGQVAYPNVSVSAQMVDLIQAESAYQANANAFTAESDTYVKALSMGA